jgi:hypothetical protein
MQTVYLGGFGLTFVAAFVYACYEAARTDTPQRSHQSEIAIWFLIFAGLFAFFWPVTVPGLILIEVIKLSFGRLAK